MADADCAVAVVGGGPAGMAAALRLAAQRIDVVLIERESDIGGVPRHCGHPPFGLREFGRLMSGPAYARRAAAAVRATGLRVMTDTTVLAVEAGPALALSRPGGAERLACRRVLLCTGARETSRAARFLGGDRMDGVLSTGALQRLVYLGAAKPFARPVILGTELVSFSAILTCLKIGARPAAMVEPTARPTTWRAALGLPRILGAPVYFETQIDAILGGERVEAARLRGADGGVREIEADGLIVSGAFMPEASLPRLSGLTIDPGARGPVVDAFGRCSDTTVFAAGNGLRAVETAGWSWREGAAAADRIVRDLEAPQPPSTHSARCDGDALKYVLPQRFTPGVVDGAVDVFQLRFARPARGRLVARSGGRMLWTRRIDGLPERRVLAPFAPIANAAGGDVVFTMEGAA